MAPAGYGNRVEGIHAVAAAVGGGRVEKLWVDARRAGRDDVAAIVSRVPADRVETVDDVRILAETDSPQGLVADCRPLQSVALEDFQDDLAAVLVLDHVEDPHNVGAAARSAAAAGMTGMVVSTRRAAPLSATTFKAAAGTLESLPVAMVGSIPEALSRLKTVGLWIVGLDSGGESSLFGLNLLTEPVAVVVGAEGRGLAQLTSKRCDVIASIPLSEQVESLNASVSAALACFEVLRVRSG